MLTIFCEVSQYDSSTTLPYNAYIYYTKSNIAETVNILPLHRTRNFKTAKSNTGYFNVIAAITVKQS